MTHIRFVLNADDYALNDAVDDAVVHLAERGVVRTTSAMVLSRRWPVAARRLEHLDIDIGLHIDLTSAAVPGWAARVGDTVALAAFARALDRRWLRACLMAQCARFEDAIGAAPAFVDGHQHVHQFPGIRTVLLDVLAQRYAERLPRIRVCKTARFRGLKAALIASLGTVGLERCARRQGFACNSDFAGVYAFSRPATAVHWRRWLLSLRGPVPMVMTHVATHSQHGADIDAIADARVAEFKWLASPGFKELCRALNACPVRWSQIDAP